MKQKFTIEKPIIPAQLHPCQQKELAQELFPVHNKIFEGVDEKEFFKYIILPNAELNKLYLCRNARGEIVGYGAFQVFLAERKSRLVRPNTFVFRSVTGLLPDYQGGSGFEIILFRECVKFSLSRFIPKAYYMATPISPIPYYVACRDFYQVYPQPDQVTPPKIDRVARRLSRLLDLQEASESNFYVKRVGWKVRFGSGSSGNIQIGNNSWINFYLSQNPAYTMGNGLMILVPATFKNAILSLIKSLKRRFTKHRSIPVFSLKKQSYQANP